MFGIVFIVFCVHLAHDVITKFFYCLRFIDNEKFLNRGDDKIKHNASFAEKEPLMISLF